MIEVWIERWREGDQTAAAQLYDHFATEIFRLTVTILGNRQDAEEVSLDVFVYALNHIHDFDPHRASFRTWLHLIAVSRSRDRLREHTFDQISLYRLFEKGIQFKSNSVLPEVKSVMEEKEDEFHNLLQQLSPKLREALILRFWAEHTYKDMAIILGCPVPTAQSRVRLGLERLRELVINGQNSMLDLREMRLE